jgi:hypothetical protein
VKSPLTLTLPLRGGRDGWGRTIHVPFFASSGFTNNLTMRGLMNNMEKKRDQRIEPEGKLNNFSVVETPIDPSVQKEYQDLSDSIDFDSVDFEEVLTEAEELFAADTPIESKKRILILLAHLGTMESSKIIEKYLKVSEESLKDWVVLSLKECRIFLESVFLNEEEGFISTGLGGRGNKLRYYFIVSTREDRTLTRSERETLEEGFTGMSDEYGTEIEEINVGTNYTMIRILVPMDVAVGEVIEEGIRRSNRMGEILFVDYYVTNVKKPTKEEISKYLSDIRREGK